MDSLKGYGEDYKVELSTAASAVVLGFISKKLLKKDILGVSSVKGAVETFLLIAVSGVVAKELLKPKFGPSPK